MEITFNINILGNGSASPHIARPPSAHCLEINHHLWLIDCGEGTQVRLMEQGIKRSKLKGICITHLHADHYLGIFGLLSSMSLDRRAEELIIIAPSRLELMLNMHLAQDGFKLPFPIRFIATDRVGDLTLLYQLDYFSILSFPLSHRVFCTGFLFKVNATYYKVDMEKVKIIGIPKINLKALANGEDLVLSDGRFIKNEEAAHQKTIAKSYAYCSDTAYLPHLNNWINGADVLYHESTFLEKEGVRASETLHSTAKQAAMVAKDGNVKKLLLGHFSSRYADLNVFEEEAKTVFGATEIATVGKVISV